MRVCGAPAHAAYTLRSAHAVPTQRISTIWCVSVCVLHTHRPRVGQSRGCAGWGLRGRHVAREDELLCVSGDAERVLDLPHRRRSVVVLARYMKHYMARYMAHHMVHSTVHSIVHCTVHYQCTTWCIP